MSDTEGLAQLDGIRVVDFSQALSGPYCTMMLADLGADVIKIENPVTGGDDARHWGPPFLGADAAYFMSVNRNKRSVACDLKDPAGLRAARALAGTADVVVENWRPGTADRLGVGAEQLRELNPRLVYCSISGYGQDEGTRSGYDQIVQGTSGVMSLTGPEGEPTKWGVPIGDIGAGMFAAASIMAVLVERERTGVGRAVDIAMQDSVVAMLTHHAARHLHTGVVAPSDHNGHATIVPYGTFRAADGFVNVCVGNNSQFQRFCRALDRADLAADPRFATNPLRVAAKQALLDALGPAIAALTVAQVVVALDEVGVPVGPVRDIGGVLADPATDRRRMLLDLHRADVDAAQVVNTPWKFDGATPTVRRPPPRLGEHTAEVFVDTAVIAAGARPATPADPLADALAAADRELDRLLTSLDVGYWRVRHAQDGCTVGERVAHLTALNGLFGRVATGRGGAGAEQLRDVQRPRPAAMGRPAALLHSWRRSCAGLHREVPSVVDAALRDWLEDYRKHLGDLTHELSRQYSQWTDRNL